MSVSKVGKCRNTKVGLAYGRRRAATLDLPVFRTPVGTPEIVATSLVDPLVDPLLPPVGAVLANLTQNKGTLFIDGAWPHQWWITPIEKNKI